MSATIQSPLLLILDFLIRSLTQLRNRIDPAPYHGGRSILPDQDSLKVQSPLITLYGEKEAQILQKFREWVDYNRAQGTHQHDGFTWTYGSYRFWHEKHFPHFSQRTLENAIRKLKKDGVLIGERGLSFARGNTAYRIDEQRIQDQIDAMERPAISYRKSFHSTLQEFPQAIEKPATHTIKKLQEKLNNPLPQDLQTTNTASVVVDFEADTGEYELEGENLADNAATLESTVDQPIVNAESLELMLKARIAPGVAKTLPVTVNQVKRVMEYQRKNPHLEIGWVVTELRTGSFGVRDTINLDIESRDYRSGKWAAFIES